MRAAAHLLTRRTSISRSHLLQHIAEMRYVFSSLQRLYLGLYGYGEHLITSMTVERNTEQYCHCLPQAADLHSSAQHAGFCVTHVSESV